MPAKTRTSITSRKVSGKPAAKAKPPAVGADAATQPAPLPEKPLSRLALIVEQLKGPSGASIAELCAVTGWQAHSIRGAIAGALKRKGHVVTSARTDGIRRYRIEDAS